MPESKGSLSGSASESEGEIQSKVKSTIRRVSATERTRDEIEDPIGSTGRFSRFDNKINDLNHFNFTIPCHKVG